MSSVVDHQLAVILAAYFTRTSGPIASDLGTITLHAEGDAVRHFVARLVDADGATSTHAVHLTIGAVR